MNFNAFKIGNRISTAAPWLVSVAAAAALLAAALVSPAFASSTADLGTPCTTVCYVDAALGDDSFGGDTPLSAKKTIQAAINQVSPGGQVRVFPGLYDETAANSFLYDGDGPYQFGLFIPDDKSGITIQGVDGGDNPIASHAGVLATVTTHATNNFGYSGTFVEGENVTIVGLRIGPNAAGSNKTIEVTGGEGWFQLWMAIVAGVLIVAVVALLVLRQRLGKKPAAAAAEETK